MSQLFDNYKKGYQNVPDNEKVYPKLKTEFKDIITLGVDNTHSFVIPFDFEELLTIEVTYIQGIEIKLKKVWNIFADWFKLDEEETSEEDRYLQGIKIYSSLSGNARLYELSNDRETLQYFKSYFESDYDKIKNLNKFCVIFYTLDSYESSLFNDYNNNLFAQLSLVIDRKDYEANKITNLISKKYRIKPIQNINLTGEDKTVKPED